MVDAPEIELTDHAVQRFKGNVHVPIKPTAPAEVGFAPGRWQPRASHRAQLAHSLVDGAAALLPAMVFPLANTASPE